MFLKTRAKNFDLTQGPLLMGIINVTPDSFADGGQYLTPEAAIAHAEKMREDGVDMIDVGGESSRPGAQPVSLEEEVDRVIPVIKILTQRFPNIPISVDTTKPDVARQALEEGASLVNDISALDNPRMIPVLREHDVPIILMHMQGDPRTMQKNPRYQDVVEDIKNFLSERMDHAIRRGLKPNQLLVDPGIGFGKTTEHNVDIIGNLRSFLELEQPIVVGASRKSFIGKLLRTENNPLPIKERLEGTLAVHIWAAEQGAHILRVHDVKATRRALHVWQAVTGG